MTRDYFPGKQWLFVILLFLNSCQTDKKFEIGEVDVSKEGNAMIDSLNNIYSRIDFIHHPYLNEEALDAFENKYPDILNSKDPNLLIEYATYLLNAGRSEKSVQILEKIKEGLPFLQEVNANTKKFYETLAIGYLRQGEQENCVSLHNSESCLFPISGKGIHSKKKGSTKAIELYLKILQKFPNDLQSKWLLNLAAMTLGSYPNEVPAEYLINSDLMSSKSNMTKFTNIAGDLDLAVNDIAGGVVLADFNKDGYLDIITSSWGMNGRLKLFINDGKGEFREESKKWGVDHIYGGLNLNQVDFNNDGYLDIYIMRGAWIQSKDHGILPNSLLMNIEGQGFKDVTIEKGLYSPGPSQTSTWLDYDLDGWVDLFVGNETVRKDLVQFPCQFFKNNKGSFTNMTNSLGLGITGYIKGVTSGDINNDGYPELFISRLDGGNYLLLNKKDDVSSQRVFQDISSMAGILPPLNSFPCWFFDYNNDGWEDLFVAVFDSYAFTNQAGEVAADLLGQSFLGDYPRLYQNNGDLSFTDVTKTAQLNRAAHTMGCNFGDINNDGFLDFYLGTGAPDFRSAVPNRMFLNNKGEHFSDVTSTLGLGHIQKGHGIGFGDMDNDGDQDIYAVMGGSYSGDIFQNAFFENPGTDNNWVTIELEGNKCNKAALGSKLKIVTKNADGSNSSFYRTVSNGASFGGNSLQLEIGLGTAVGIDSVFINWANGENDYMAYGTIPMKTKVLIKELDQSINVIQQKIIHF